MAHKHLFSGMCGDVPAASQIQALAKFTVKGILGNLTLRQEVAPEGETNRTYDATLGAL
jgi:hypothetical protein